MKTLIHFTFVLFLTVTFVGCSKSSNSKREASEDFELLVNNWNKAHSSKDVAVFSELYDNSVLFYGKQKDKNDCIETKLSLFKKQPDFYQQIFGDIQIEELNESEVKCSFVKRVTLNKQTNDYPSYLTFKEVDGNWKIITEGDLVTDKNLSKQKDVKIPKDATKGDFNGDGTLDFAWLVAPKLKEDGMDCVGDCSSYIKFSDTSIPEIKVENCIGGTPNNLGDLNKNGTDEIGLLPDWFTSCWKGYYVWTLKNNNWIYAVEPFSTHCNQWEEGVKPIEIDQNNEGYVIIRYSEMTDDEIKTKSKSVRIK